ncbi:hypothetical protein BOH72_01425 [Mycobacterium sp. WY10]|nr:hypothetical protein BOH72_01425 [Mycobacterium sp. WY10]
MYKSDAELHLIGAMYVLEDWPTLNCADLFRHVSGDAPQPVRCVGPCGLKVLLPKQQEQDRGRVASSRVVYESDLISGTGVS